MGEPTPAPCEQENDSDDEDFIREMEEGLTVADGIDPLFLDDDDDDENDFDTITIGETGFQYKVRAGGLDGAPDLGGVVPLNPPITV